MSKVKVYGAGWCGQSLRTRGYLETLGVEYEYIDCDDDPAASEWVKSQNDGKEKKPTLDICGRVLSCPTNQQLESTLREEKVL